MGFGNFCKRLGAAVVGTLSAAVTAFCAICAVVSLFGGPENTIYSLAAEASKACANLTATCFEYTFSEDLDQAPSPSF